MGPRTGRFMTGESRVRFADGFDRPERIAFGLEAPQLAVVVAGSLLAWSIVHGGAPTFLRSPVAALIALLTAALGWGRWQERPLLTWAWLAARFMALPRSGGGAVLLDAARGDAETTKARTVAAGPSQTGDAEGAAPPPPPRRGPRRRGGGTERGHRDAGDDSRASTPAWLRWLSPRAVEEAPAADEALAVSASALGDLEFGNATHALITGRRRAEPLRPAEPAGAPREAVVLLPTTPRSQARSDPRASSSGLADAREAEVAPARVLRLHTAELPNTGGLAPLELDDRAEPVTAGLLPAEPRRRMVGRTRRMAFFALSGGNGRTTLAVETACLVAAEGHRVALLDLDLHAPAVAMRLGLPQPERWDPQILGGDRITCLDDLLVTHSSGARVMLAPARAASGDTLAPARVAELLHLLERDGAELVLVDLPGDLSALSAIALAAMDEVFIVVTPTARGAQDAYRTTEALRRIGLGGRLSYVVNRARTGGDHPSGIWDHRSGSGAVRARIGGRSEWIEHGRAVDSDLRADVDLTEVMGDLGGEVVATVPFDAGLEAGEDTHRPIGMAGRGPAAPALRRLGLRLTGSQVAARRDAGPAWR